MASTQKSAAAALAAALLSACSPATAPATNAPQLSTHASPAPFSAWFPLRVGSASLEAQVAILPLEQQQGLMHRRDLGPSQGMLFAYPEPRPMAFWMRNTPTPLDVGFFTADGTLTEVRSLYPFDESPVRAARTDLTFALEMHQGWFAANGLRPGDRLDARLLEAALAARGFQKAR